MLYSGKASNGEVTVIGSTLVVKQNFTSAVPLPQTCDSSLVLKKTPENSQLGTFYKISTSPHNCQGHQNKGSLGNCHRQQRLTETRRLTAMRRPGQHRGTEKWR